ncbi:MAG: MBL fold metallo-hydrolase [Clostridiales bacterium]|nr:MBL fold metallo-hydrolase [Clostridiales bacterium]
MKFLCVVTGICRTNTYIIEENNEAIIIDPTGDFKEIKSTLSSISARPKYVLVTHGHFDHVGGVSALQDMGAKAYVPSADYKLLVETNFSLGLDEEDVAPFCADVEVNDGDMFTLLGHEFKALSTPGHTLGGTCYIMDDKTIFSGDTLFRLSIGRTDLPYADNDCMLNSLKRLFALNGDYDVFPGHGKQTALEFERKYNPYAKA